ncbi:hypothetical protein [Rasiella sp. SM2506]|uniref:hypothetical protein n=1 Tax=Rasiella sp. SM2506 TaxID=3423914 RepID=UPI003D7A777D
MIRFLLKAIFLITLVGFILQEVDAYFIKDSFYRDSIRTFQSSDRNFDIVFFGSSHSYSTFNPAVIENELNVTAINLGSSAQKLIATQVVADMVLKKNRPDLAVINVFALSFNEEKNEGFTSSNLLAIDFLPQSFSKSSFILNTFPANEWPMAFSETIRNHTEWPESKKPSKTFNYNNDHNHYKGFLTSNSTFDDGTFLKFEKKYKAQNKRFDTLPDIAKKRIDDIADLFKNNNVPVLFINAPSYVYDVSPSHNSYAKSIKSYLTEKGHNFLEFNEVKEEIGITRRHYRNPNHLNTRGAILASTYLSAYIKDSLHIPLTKTPINLSGNPYYQSNPKNNSLFYKDLDSVTEKKLFGITDAKLYKTGEETYNVLFSLSADTIGSQPFRLEHEVTLEELNQYGEQKIFQNRNKTKIVYYGDFSNIDVLTYQNKSFVVFSFKSPLKQFRNLSFHAGDKRGTTVFSIDTLSVK